MALNETQTDTNGDPVQQPSVQAVLEVQFSVSPLQDAGEMVYRLICTVVTALNIDSNIFVYELVPQNPTRPATTYRFVTVATPIHMQELPIDTATAESNYMCRRDSVDLYLRSPADVEESRDAILRRIRLLCQNIESLATIQDTLRVQFTFQTDEADSSIGSIPG